MMVSWERVSLQDMSHPAPTTHLSVTVTSGPIVPDGYFGDRGQKFNRH